MPNVDRRFIDNVLEREAEENEDLPPDEDDEDIELADQPRDQRAAQQPVYTFGAEEIPIDNVIEPPNDDWQELATAGDRMERYQEGMGIFDAYELKEQDHAGGNR